MKVLRVICTFFLCLWAGGVASAGEQKPYWRWYADDSLEIAKAVPEREFVQKLFILCASGAVLYRFDDDIAREFAKNNSSIGDRFAKAGEALGNGANVAAALAAGWAYGALGNDKKAETAAKLGLESFVLSGLAVNGIKYAAGRHRPKEGDGSGEWETFKFKGGSSSFPSGHSATAFAWATIAADVYGDKQWVAPVAYGAATLTALSRVYDKEHWGSDVLVGSLLGYFTSKALLAMHREEWSVSVLPVAGGTVVEVAFRY